jgi:rod shape-determining protein MreD
MNWLVFTLISYLAVTVQRGMRPVWMIDSVSLGDVSPSLLLITLVFVTLHAPNWPALWGALTLGVLAEVLATPMPEAVLLGPHTLGFLAGGYAILQLRGMVFRQSLLAFVVLVMIAGLFVQLVAVALLTARGIPWPLGEPVPGWSAADQLVERFLDLLYTAALAVPLGWALFRTTPIWGFAGKVERR